LICVKKAMVVPCGMTNQRLKVVSVKLPERDLSRIVGNRSDFIRRAVAEKLQKSEQPVWRPKTAAVRKMLKLREQFIADGGQLLDAQGIAEELRSRRGGVD
jgi:hypothetical protein